MKEKLKIATATILRQKAEELLKNKFSSKENSYSDGDIIMDCGDESDDDE